jgi:tRNA modification GTPase
MAEADLLLVLIDASQGLFEQEESLLRKYQEKKKVLAVINKIDLAPTASEAIRQKVEGTISTVAISATQGLGLEELKEAIQAQALSIGVRGAEGVLVAHVRHKSALIATQTHLEQALESVKAGMPEEIIALEIRDALDRLGEIIGATTTEEILDRIFQSFCIGK